MDDPFLLPQSTEGERHQLRQTVLPVLLDDGALQNGQPPTGRPVFTTVVPHSGAAIRAIYVWARGVSRQIKLYGY